MKTFDFYVDEKVTTWMRTHFQIEAKSLNDAKGKAKLFVTGDEHTNLPWHEIDGVFGEKMSIEENSGEPTLEIFTSNGEGVYQNSKD